MADVPNEDVYLLPYKADGRPKSLTRAAKRSLPQREHDLYIIAGLYLRGKPGREILAAINDNYQKDGANLSLAIDTIYDDIKEIHKRWVNSSLVDFNMAKGRELEQWNHLEATFWEMYERSLEAKTTTEIQKLTDQIAFAVDQVVPVTRTKKRRRIEVRDGSIAALEGVAMCIKERCKILGLYSPEKIQVDWRVEAVKAGVPEKEADQIFEDLVGQYVEAMEQEAEGTEPDKE